MTNLLFLSTATSPVHLLHLHVFWRAIKRARI